MRKLTLVMLGSAVLSVCQTGYTGYLTEITVRYDSSPQSALVTCGGTQQGYTPVDVNYKVVDREDGFLKVPPCKATWVSGAQSSYKTIIGEWGQSTDLKTTVNRPKHPNISNDIKFDYQRNKDANDAARQDAADARQAAINATARQDAAYARQSAINAAARQDAADDEARQNAAAVAHKKDVDDAISNLNNYNNSHKPTFCNRIGTQVMCF